MTAICTDDWWYFQHHLERWKSEMLLPRDAMDSNIAPELLHRHKDRLNEILDKTILILNGKPVTHRDAFFTDFFAAQDAPWRTLLPILFYLECERSDIGRLMMADLKLKPFDEEPLFAMTKGFYPSACVICKDPFLDIDAASWATQKPMIRCARRSCRYEWDSLMRPIFEAALDGALTIGALRVRIQHEGNPDDIRMLEKVIDDTLSHIEKAYTYLLRFFYKREKAVRDAEENEPIKRQPFPPRYRISLSFQRIGKEFWPGNDLRLDPSIILNPTLRLSEAALQTPTALDKAVKKLLKAKKRKKT